MEKRRNTDEEFRVAQNKSAKVWREKLRRETFQAYGGEKCACCGEIEAMFLQLDHIAGDGAEERRRISGVNYGGIGSFKLYKHLKDLGWPYGYQVLCANCNTGKYRNGGLCLYKTSV